MKNGPVKKPYRKLYDPTAMAFVLDMGQRENKRAGVIQPGTTVTVSHHFGPFRLIQDDETGVTWSVWKQALKPMPKVK